MLEVDHDRAWTLLRKGHLERPPINPTPRFFASPHLGSLPSLSDAANNLDSKRIHIHFTRISTISKPFIQDFDRYMSVNDLQSDIRHIAIHAHKGPGTANDLTK